MIGSLQEFIGIIDHEKFLTIEPRNRGKRKSTYQSRSLQKTNKKDTFLQSNPPKTAHISSIKYQTKAKQSQRLFKTNGRDQEQCFQSRTSVKDNCEVRDERQMKMPKWNEHIPDNKQNLFKAFMRLRRHEQHHSNGKIIEKLRESTMQNQVKDVKPPMHTHLKGHLKHEHQLLRSIVRVEEEGLFNPKTFLELSLESITQSYSKIRIKPLLRTDELSEQLLDTLKEDEKRESEDRHGFKSQVFSSGFKYIAPKAKPKNSIVSSTHRILLQNERRWAKSRTKSTKSYEKSLDSAQLQQDQSTKLKRDRKELLRRINQQITRPKTIRKGSLIEKSF